MPGEYLLCPLRPAHSASVPRVWSELHNTCQALDVLANSPRQSLYLTNSCRQSTVKERGPWLDALGWDS